MMKKLEVTMAVIAALFLTSFSASAQQEAKNGPEEAPVVITLEQALEIALSENVSVKVADLEIKRTQYAKKGTYAALFPQIDASGAYQRTIKKQVMYMDFDMSSLGGLGGLGGGTGSGEGEGAGDGTGEGTQIPDGVQLPGGSTDSESGSSSNNGGGLEVGRWNTWSAGVSAAMPLVSAQLWQSLKLSGLDVELAVEKARSSRLDMVSQVKTAYFGILLAKEAFEVYKQAYENALQNMEDTQMRYDAQKASQVELLAAKTTLANAVPNVYNAESSVILALWQLKAVMGVDLDMNLDVA